MTDVIVDLTPGADVCALFVIENGSVTGYVVHDVPRVPEIIGRSFPGALCHLDPFACTQMLEPELQAQGLGTAHYRMKNGDNLKERGV